MEGEWGRNGQSLRASDSVIAVEMRSPATRGTGMAAPNVREVADTWMAAKVPRGFGAAAASNVDSHCVLVLQPAPMHWPSVSLFKSRQ